MQQTHNRDARWATRRKELVESLAPTVRASHPTATWSQLARMIDEAADLQLLYERFGREP